MEPGAPMYNKTIERSSIMEVKVQTEQEEGICYYICIVHVHTCTIRCFQPQFVAGIIQISMTMTWR